MRRVDLATDYEDRDLTVPSPRFLRNIPTIRKNVVVVWSLGLCALLEAPEARPEVVRFTWNKMQDLEAWRAFEHSSVAERVQDLANVPILASTIASRKVEVISRSRRGGTRGGRALKRVWAEPTIYVSRCDELDKTEERQARSSFAKR